LSQLTLGVKCGVSDATSGIAANPATGVAADMIVRSNGTVIFGETTEIIGAEHILAKRAVNEEVARRIYEVAERMENIAKSMGMDIRGSQPTPGNIEGGLTTIEEKSLGAILKAGSTPIQKVLDYAQIPTGKGLFFMDSPGRELELITGLAVAGAQIVLFTTGLGAPIGLPILPLIKISGNPATSRKMRDDIDLDVGTIIEKGESVEGAGKRIFREIVKTASGKKTKSEALGYGFVDIYRIEPTI